ncbi:CocE/NonD family hydrolase C-terminal non-catalytic domain-containing protein [Nocardia brasiliensis]|uniref:CocE/NonD family hydrolase C-terminal non-catalytic domain-containing protein n=1 Tax=Nocardia brasiliensis TaxID=37326 RepID=UPI003D8F7A76
MHPQLRGQLPDRRLGIGIPTQADHTSAWATRQPLTPGAPTTLDIALHPTHAELQPGHRLRVDVYASNFPKGLPITATLIDSALAPQHLLLDPSAPSWINIATTDSHR